MKSTFKEPVEEIKALKVKELNCMMKIGWEKDLETCDTVERALGDLVAIFEQSPASEEEKVFVQNAVKVIEASCHRPCKVQLK